MKTTLLLFSCALCSLSQADLVIKQTIDSPTMKGDMVMSIKGQQMRTDIGKDSSTIMNGATGDMMTLMHPQKMMMKVDGAITKAQIEAMKKPAPAATEAEKAAAEAAAPKPNGKKEKIAGYECEIYESTTAVSTVSLWVTKDFPNYEAINKEMSSLTSSLATSATAPQPILPGMVMKTVITAAGQVITTTLVSAETKPVDEAIFNAPAGYKDPTAAASK